MKDEFCFILMINGEVEKVFRDKEMAQVYAKNKEIENQAEIVKTIIDNRSYYASLGDRSSVL